MIVDDNTEWVVIKTKKPINKRKLWIFLCISTAVVVSLTAILLVAFVSRNKSYYESNEFINMDTKSQLITIAQREGEYNNGFYVVGYEDYVDDSLYSMSLVYWTIYNELSFGLIYRNDEIQMKVQMYFCTDDNTEDLSSNIDTMHMVICEVYSNDDIKICGGMLKLYAPGFYEGKLLHFDVWDGGISQVTMERTFSAAMIVVIGGLKKILSKYNFDIQRLFFTGVSN